MNLSESFERLKYKKKANRVKHCGDFLDFKRIKKTNELKLHSANFCKVRLCPMCNWRRSLKVFSQVSRVMETAVAENDCRFIFLTLTCRNVKGVLLADQLDKLFHAYKKIMERKQVKKAVKGWFRSLEITHNLNKKSDWFDTYHPHFHIVLMINKSYFTKPELYIPQDEWVNLWKSCLGVDYTPIVDIRSVRQIGKRTAKAAAETAKYAVKDSDVLIKKQDGQIDEELTDRTVKLLNDVLAYRRLVAYGGELKEIHRRLNLDDAEDGDLVHTDSEELQPDLEYVLEHYKWHVGYRQYVRYNLPEGITNR